MELEEERNNSDLLSERITRSREQVLFCRWVMCGSSCMEKEMWEVNPEDLTGGGGESPGLMEMMERWDEPLQGRWNKYRKVCSVNVSRVAMENNLFVTTGKCF